LSIRHPLPTCELRRGWFLRSAGLFLFRNTQHTNNEARRMDMCECKSALETLLASLFSFSPFRYNR
jgi:hypothetical protein